MEFQELRIGNLVLLEGQDVKVVGLDLDLEDEGEPLIKVYTFQMEKSPIGGHWIKCVEKNYTHFQPIPITEKWLLKLGFEKSRSEWSLDCDGLFLCFEFFEDGFCYTGGEGIPFSKQIKFVHQLQNIVFALTGEELKCNHQ